LRRKGDADASDRLEGRSVDGVPERAKRFADTRP
jgi:hypothetical protein